MAVMTSCSGAVYDLSFVEPSYEIQSPPASGDKFDSITDNKFIRTADENISTFSIDADGAAYSYMKRSIGYDCLPDANSVRIEEFLNYFTYDYADPVGNDAVAISSEVGDCPWNSSHKLLRLGIKGKSIAQNEMPLANFVFLVDVSGSMSSADKLPLLKNGLSTMVDYLNPNDRVSIITYSGKVSKVLESTLASDAKQIKKAISKLTASGSTNGGDAIKMAYKEALDNFIAGGNNRVIMGTDGDFNVGVTSTDALLELVEENAKNGIYLTVCGFGSGNLNDAMMEKVSNSGNGTYEYIADEGDLTKVFVNERSKFLSVANDVKVQVTFDTAKVEEYRLIGYENRVLSNEDFENDEKDAGELGAGQTVTALYELVLADGAESSDALGKFDLRYKKALGSESIPLSTNFVNGTDLSAETSFAASLAAFGMMLRVSPYKGDADYDMVLSLARKGTAFDPFDYRKAFVDLVQKAKTIE